MTLQPMGDTPMSQVELAGLVTEIEGWLHSARAQSAREATPSEPAARGDAATEYWGERPRISNAEMRMLQALSRGPVSVERIAARLDRSEVETARFLEALRAIGLVQHEGDRYGITETALAYLQLFLEW